MFSRKQLYLLAIVIVIGWTMYMFANKEYFIREHLSNSTPTLSSLQKDLDETNKKLNELNTDYQQLKERGQAQSSQAAAAAAALQSIPSGSANTIIPTR